MELKLGKMTTKELSKWFGVSYETFRHYKDKKLEELKDFAKFEIIYGGVIIKEIIYPQYIKYNSKYTQLYLEQVQKYPLNSIAAMVDDISTRDEFIKIPEGTLKYQLTKAGTIGFGVTKNKDSRGLYGWRKYQWAIKTYNIETPYREFTKEEEEMFDRIISTFYLDNVEKIKQSALLEEEFKQSTMTKDEYFQKKEELGLNLFGQIIKLFKERTGLQIVRATQHELDEMYKEGAW